MKKTKINYLLSALLICTGIGLFIYNNKTSQAATTYNLSYKPNLSSAYSSYTPYATVGRTGYCYLYDNGTVSGGEICNDEQGRNLYYDPLEDPPVFRFAANNYQANYTIDGVPYTETWTNTWPNPTTGEAWAYNVDVRAGGTLVMTQKWLATQWFTFKASTHGDTRREDHINWIFDGENMQDPTMSTYTTPAHFYLPTYNPNLYDDGGAMLVSPSNDLVNFNFDTPTMNTIYWHLKWQSEGKGCNPGCSNNWWYIGWLTYKQAGLPGGMVWCGGDCDNWAEGTDIMFRDRVFEKQYRWMVPSKWLVKIEIP